MATVITVHGTNATGPESGNRWWQKGSPFEKQLRELVESEDGDLNFEPLIWMAPTARPPAGRLRGGWSPEPSNWKRNNKSTA
jgi:hypothetical protein